MYTNAMCSVCILLHVLDATTGPSRREQTVAANTAALSVRRTSNLLFFFPFFYLCLDLLPTLLLCPGSLQTSKEDLLQADFEGALKFFRVQLPKRYRAAENARRLMEQACNIKVRRATCTRSSKTLLSLCFWIVENVLRELPSFIQTNLDWCKVRPLYWKFLCWCFTLGEQFL